MSNTENQKEDTTFLDAYLDAMLWTEEERLEKELGSPAGLVDLSFETITRVRKECKRFLTKEVKILINGHEEQAGHDFWLTRNGHGAGYWDHHQHCSNDHILCRRYCLPRVAASFSGKGDYTDISEAEDKACHALQRINEIAKGE